MASTDYPQRYKDAFVQEKHREIHSPKTLLRPLEPVLPPGVSQHDFETAISKLTKLLGSEGVLVGNALVDYIDPYELWELEGKRRVPSAAVCPKSVVDVQGVVGIAREFKIPLWTFSRGKNLGYGGPAPRVPGSIALDLHRMDKVIEASDEYCYAVVEPGVTFFDLYKHCKDNNLRVWPSVATLGWGSVLGNTLDRGIGFTPTANHHQNMAGLEVVLGTGEIIRTGQFAMTDSPLAHTSKYSLGPSIEGLFLQSNLGIVTKLGIWLTPQPQAYMSCLFDMPRMEDIEAMVDILGPLKRNGTLLPTSPIYINNVLELTSPLANRETLWKGKGAMPESRIQQMLKDFDVGYWNAQFGLYGPKNVIQAQFDEVKRLVESKAPTGRIRGEIFSGEGEDLLDALKVPERQGGVFTGIPGMAVLPMVKYRILADKPGIPAHCDYSVFIPSNGAKALEWVKIAREIHEREGHDFFCNFNVHERHVMGVHLMAYDKAEPEQRRAVDRIWFGLYPEAVKKGYGSYRCHVNHMDPLADMYDFNNHAYRRFLETIKDAIDPDGILSPGKMGIWPRGLQANKEKL